MELRIALGVPPTKMRSRGDHLIAFANRDTIIRTNPYRFHHAYVRYMDAVRLPACILWNARLDRYVAFVRDTVRRFDWILELKPMPDGFHLERKATGYRPPTGYEEHIFSDAHRILAIQANMEDVPIPTTKTTDPYRFWTLPKRKSCAGDAAKK